MRRPVIGAVLVLCAAAVDAADPQAPVALGDEETIVFYGDSITEQNLYSAYLETLFASRFPSKRVDRAHPPETDRSAVGWKEARFEGGRIDLGAQYTGASNVVAYTSCCSR